MLADRDEGFMADTPVVDQKSLRVILREKFPRDQGQLLPALHFLQHEFGYLPDWAMELTGWHLGIPVSEVYGAATSYTELRVEKPGEYVVRVCTGLGCRVNGGKELLAAAESALGVHAGETAADGSVTLEETACGFLCGMAPAVEIDGDWRGRATPESLKSALQEAASK
jgi:NADH:ubiquinone oxidoreductase subunit E